MDAEQIVEALLADLAKRGFHVGPDDVRAAWIELIQQYRDVAKKL